MNLPQQLAYELVRVANLRATYEQFRDIPGVNIEAAIALMMR